MSNYRRALVQGATYFFTVNCAERSDNCPLLKYISELRQAFRNVKNNHPFTIDAIVVLPEHLHCIWTLPSNDMDYKTRWALIKADFSRKIPKGEGRSVSRINRGERGIWQRRYWEHLIRDNQDFARHVDYIHWNPVKHGYVKQAINWPYSSFHIYLQRGVYTDNWQYYQDDITNCGE